MRPAFCGCELWFPVVISERKQAAYLFVGAKNFDSHSGPLFCHMNLDTNLSRNLYSYWKIANERRHLCSTLIQVVSTFRTKNSGSFQISFSRVTSLTYLSMYIWEELLVKVPPEFLESSFFNVFNFPFWLFVSNVLE